MEELEDVRACDVAKVKSEDSISFQYTTNAIESSIIKWYMNLGLEEVLQNHW